MAGASKIEKPVCVFEALMALEIQAALALNMLQALPGYSNTSHPYHAAIHTAALGIVDMRTSSRDLRAPNINWGE